MDIDSAPLCVNQKKCEITCIEKRKELNFRTIKSNNFYKGKSSSKVLNWLKIWSTSRFAELLSTKAVKLKELKRIRCMSRFSDMCGKRRGLFSKCCQVRHFRTPPTDVIADRKGKKILEELSAITGRGRALHHAVRGIKQEM